MKKALLFLRLYVHALAVSTLKQRRPKPSGIKGAAVFLFRDKPGGMLHGVVAFVIGKQYGAEDFGEDLYGPFGYTSEIDLEGLHLYGRDTWGSPQPHHFELNPALQNLRGLFPNDMIMLAGVRKFSRWHLPPINNPRNFILPFRVSRRED